MPLSYEFPCTLQYRPSQRELPCGIRTGKRSRMGEVFCGRRKSIPCAAFINSMARICSRLSMMRNSFCCGIGAHTHMVFLSVAGYDGIAAGGITVHLVLAHHGSSGILGNHEARIQTGIGNQELRQSAQPHDELGNAAFGDITQLGKGYAQKVVRNSQRCP